MAMQRTPLEYREWRDGNSCDVSYLAPLAKKLRSEQAVQFMEGFRPVLDELAEAIWKRLFVGIDDPFPGMHGVGANGWLREFWDKVQTRKDSASPAQLLDATLRWNDADTALGVCDATAVYACEWRTFLRFTQNGWVNHDTAMICHSIHREIALYSEGAGPFFGQRGKRILLR